MPSFPSRKRLRCRAGFAPRLILMVKEPRAGRVKTRLARDIGVSAATAVYRAMLAQTVARVSATRRWHTLLAVSPDPAIASTMLPRSLARLAQGRGDLGDRMAAAMGGAPPGPVIVIGTDCPQISAEAIGKAFRALGAHDAVLGPAGDGGYWLVGFRRRGLAGRAFACVPWSTPRALATTVNNLEGFKVALADAFDDVDDARDLMRMRQLIGRRIAPSP